MSGSEPLTEKTLVATERYPPLSQIPAATPIVPPFSRQDQKTPEIDGSAASAKPRATNPAKSSDLQRPPQKLKRLPWVIGGIVALLIVVIGTALMIIKDNSSVPNQWRDTESNRQADQAAGIAARVNDKPITLGEVDRAVNQQAQDQKVQLSPLELKQVRLKVLDSLIQREALVQRAEKENLVPTDDQITVTITRQKQESGMTDEEFQSKLKQQNMTMEQLREEARRDLAIKNLQGKWTGTITVSDREVEDYYENNRQQFDAKYLKLESPGVREEIGKALVNQKKEIVNAQLLTNALNDANIVNYLAAS